MSQFLFWAYLTNTLVCLLLLIALFLLYVPGLTADNYHTEVNPLWIWASAGVAAFFATSAISQAKKEWH